MKKFTLIGMLLVFTFVFAKAQETTIPDVRLLSRYTESEIFNMQENYPQSLKIECFELNHGYQIQELDFEKMKGMPSLYYFNYFTKTKEDLVLSVDEANFNLYDYYYERHYSQNTYYRIGETNKVLVIISHKQLIRNFNTNSHE